MANSPETSTLESNTLEANTLDRLHPELADSIVDYLAQGADRIRAAGACRSLRSAVARADARLRSLELCSTRLRIVDCASWLPLFSSLRTLSLAGCATDALVAHVVRASASLEGLRVLDLSKSPRLTDVGLDALTASGEAARSALRRLALIDLTFSSGTTYNACLQLGRAMPQLVIQRLPVWLQGRFRTPWGEHHTYFADGSFSFDRSSQAAGYVRWLRIVQPHAEQSSSDRDSASPDERPRTLSEQPFAVDSLQYIDFAPPPTWPPWVRFVYRPGVALSRSPSSGHVLVSQLLSGLRAPRRLPPLPVGAIPLGGRIFVRISGEVAPSGTSEDEATSGSFDLMFSCMPVESLWELHAASQHSDGGQSAGNSSAGESEPSAWHWLMPPAELRERIAAFELERVEQQLDEPTLEGLIASALAPADAADLEITEAMSLEAETALEQDVAFQLVKAELVGQPGPWLSEMTQ